MMKLLIAGAILALAAVAIPATAVTVTLNQTANADNIPFLQTTQTVFISASSVSSAVLNITSLTADDAVVVSLNGTALTGAGIFGPGNGHFFFTAAGPSTPFTFGANGAQNLSFTAPFVAGNNIVTVTYNNNNAGINVNNGSLTGGPGFFLFNGTVSFVPEPATWGLLIAGFAMTGFAMRRRTVVTA